MRQRPEELVVDALNDVNEIFANIWGLGYEAGIKAADKATEKRVVREVIEIINKVSDDYYTRPSTQKLHPVMQGLIVALAEDIVKDLKQKYRVKR